MPLTLTERAAGKIRDIFARHKVGEHACLRVSVSGGGCDGFLYQLDVADAPAADDETSESGGVRIVCDPRSALYLNGTEIDYDDQLAAGGFVFNNPNAAHRCGCGASFCPNGNDESGEDDGNDGSA